MPSLSSLPLETLEHVFLFLETSQDLLHTALSCKAFYEMIIPTYHLHFANISCSLLCTPAAFWEKLSNSPRLCSMIRQLELCGNGLYHSDSCMKQPGLRIDEGFVTSWTNRKLSEPLPSETQNLRANLRNFMRCLECLDRCKSIILIEEPGPEEEFNDLLASISVNLSANLQTLIISRFCCGRSQDYVPQYTPSVCYCATDTAINTYRLDRTSLSTV